MNLQMEKGGDKVEKYFIIKDLTENKNGEFIAYASTSDADRQNEIISDKALKDASQTVKKMPLFYGHDGSTKIDNVLGKIEVLGYDEKGFKVKGILSKANSNFELAYDLLKMKALDKLSIGFRAFEDFIEKNEAGQTVYNKIDLLETSIVPIPANPNAQIFEVKSNEKIKEKEMSEEQLTMLLEKVDSLMEKISSVDEKLNSLLEQSASDAQEAEANQEEEELKSLMKGKINGK